METLEQAPYLLFTITDEQGNIVRRLKKDVVKGVNRLTWDFRYPSPSAISLSSQDLSSPFSSSDDGYMVVPGTYRVALSKYEDGKFTELVKPVSFKTVSLNNSSIAVADRVSVNTFNKKVSDLTRAVNSANLYKNELQSKVAFYKKAILETPAVPVNTTEKVLAFEKGIELLNRKLNGDPLRGRYESVGPTSLRSKINSISGGLWSTTAAPTSTYIKSYEVVADMFTTILSELRALSKLSEEIEHTLETSGAPFTPGRLPVWNK